MKRQGNIEVVETIEKLIRQTDNYRLLRGKEQVKFQGDEPSAVFTRLYEVYTYEFVFTMQLEFDYRINRGRFTWQHKENPLYQAIPGLREQLLSLYPMTNGWRRTANYKQQVDTPYDVKRLMMLADSSNKDEFAKQSARETLVGIRDSIAEVLR